MHRDPACQTSEASSNLVDAQPGSGAAPSSPETRRVGANRPWRSKGTAGRQSPGRRSQNLGVTKIINLAGLSARHLIWRRERRASSA
jgi:hypothetical protein